MCIYNHDEILINFLIIFYKMHGIFRAMAFNQPINLNTANVEDVRVTCVHSNHAD